MLSHRLAGIIVVIVALFLKQVTEASDLKVHMNLWRQWDRVCEIMTVCEHSECTYGHQSHINQLQLPSNIYLKGLGALIYVWGVNFWYSRSNF